MATTILLYHPFNLFLCHNGFLIVGCSLRSMGKILCSIHGGKEGWTCYILWSSFVGLLQPRKIMITFSNCYLGGRDYGWKESRCVGNMFDSMSKCLIKNFFQDFTSKCLQEYSSKEKESRTRSTSKGSSHKKQNVLKEN